MFFLWRQSAVARCSILSGYPTVSTSTTNVSTLFKCHKKRNNSEYVNGQELFTTTYTTSRWLINPTHTCYTTHTHTYVHLHFTCSQHFYWSWSLPLLFNFVLVSKITKLKSSPHCTLHLMHQLNIHKTIKHTRSWVCSWMCWTIVFHGDFNHTEFNSEFNIPHDSHSAVHTSL